MDKNGSMVYIYIMEPTKWVTYYNLYKAGIQPSWSDQNDLSGLEKSTHRSSDGAKAAKPCRPSPSASKRPREALKSPPNGPRLRQIDAETAERRRLAALEWLGQALEVKEEAKAQVPGVGLSAERLALAAQLLAQREPDLGAFTGARLRKELETMLGLDAGGLKALLESF